MLVVASRVCELVSSFFATGFDLQGPIVSMHGQFIATLQSKTVTLLQQIGMRAATHEQYNHTQTQAHAHDVVGVSKLER
jgi:hypothetical protein